MKYNNFRPYKENFCTVLRYILFRKFLDRICITFARSSVLTIYRKEATKSKTKYFFGYDHIFTALVYHIFKQILSDMSNKKRSDRSVKGLTALFCVIYATSADGQASRMIAKSSNQKIEVAQIHINGLINDDLYNRLRTSVEYVLTHGGKDIVLVIDSGGGELQPAFKLYNYLRGVPAVITTYNINQVSSAANILYLAGSRRAANPLSYFFFHDFSSPDQPTDDQSRKQKFGFDQMFYDNYSKIVSSNSKIKSDDVVKMMKNRELLSPEKALEYGLVQSIVPFQLYGFQINP